MNWFLKAKHWQLFLIIFGLPIAFRLIIFTTFFFSSEDELILLTPLLVLSTIANFISILLFFGWLWSVGVTFQKHTPDSLKQNLNYFKIAVIIPFIISVTIAILFQLSFGENSFNPDFIGFTFFVLFVYVMVLFAILTVPMVYCIFFVAKTIKILELKKEVKLSDYISEFVFIVLFPFGIWVIQPLINQIKNKTIT
jgi:hypothetical protein